MKDFTADDLDSVAGVVEEAGPGDDDDASDKCKAAWAYAANVLRAEAERLRTGGDRANADARRAYLQGYQHGLDGHPSRVSRWRAKVRPSYSEGYALGAEQRAHA
jgi:hypothetical protein